MDKRFAGRVVLVTGGGSGIGRATALAFAREGAHVIVSGRRAAALEETVAFAATEPGPVQAVPADVTDDDDVAALVDAAAALGGLDIAVNNAGVLVDGRVDELDRDAWDRALNTNLTGTWLSMKHEIRHMRARGGGAIVNLSSVVGPRLTLPGRGLYGATKAAINALTRAAAVENIGAGIRINTVCPAAVDTSMSFEAGESTAERDERLGGVIPAGRVGRVQEVADAVLWLAGPESTFTVGHELVLDGGVTV